MLGTPPGSTPTETTGARDRVSTSMNESLPVCTTDGTELVPTDENELARDAAKGHPVGRPARRVGLVGEPNFNVLGIARNSRIDQSGRMCGVGRDNDVG